MSSLARLLSVLGSQSNSSKSKETVTLPDGCPKVMSYIHANLNDPEELAQVLKSRPELVEQLRTPFKARLNFRRNKKDRSINALMWVCNQNKTDIARVLIEADNRWRATKVTADPHAVPLPGSLVNHVVMKQSIVPQPGRFPTALFVAAQHTENTTCFQLLLENGADVTLINIKGENIINHIISVAPRQSDPNKIVKRGYDRSDPVHILTALFDNDRCMREFYTADALNSVPKNTGGKAPLFRAIIHNYVATVKLLIRKGADLNKQDDQKWTALHWAVSRDDFIGIRKLLRAGAKDDLRNEDGKTPIELARWRYTVKVYNDILERALEKRRRASAFAL